MAKTLDMTVHDSSRTEDGFYKATLIADGDALVYPLDIDKLDLNHYMFNPVMLWAHDVDTVLPVARSRSITLNDDEQLDVEFEFNEHYELGRIVKQSWDDGYLNALSAGYLPTGKRSAMLKEISFVSIPHDPGSIKEINSYLSKNSRSSDMEKDEIQVMIDDSLKLLRADLEPVINAYAKESSEKNAETPEVETPKDDEESAQNKIDDLVKNQVDAKVQVINAAGDLLKDVDPSEMSTRDLMIHALGKEIEDAENRDDAYVSGAFDIVMDRRSKASEKLSQNSDSSQKQAFISKPMSAWDIAAMEV